MLDDEFSRCIDWRGDVRDYAFAMCACGAHDSLICRLSQAVPVKSPDVEISSRVRYINSQNGKNFMTGCVEAQQNVATIHAGENTASGLSAKFSAKTAEEITRYVKNANVKAGSRLQRMSIISSRTAATLKSFGTIPITKDYAKSVTEEKR